MITSYLTPEGNMLYLSLIGPLNARGADELVNEYYERHAPEVRRCVLDLGSAEAANEEGLLVLNRLSLLAQVDGVEFSLVARGSVVEASVADAARRFCVPVVDRSDVSLAG